jgi:hypothetical protein
VDRYRQLLTLLAPGKVLEWGPGPNTRLALAAGATVVTREFDRRWVPADHPPGLRVELVDWRASGWTALGADRDADVFFIDSRRRSDCLAAVFDQASPHALACLHDAQRRRYHSALSRFGHVYFPDPGFAIASRSPALLRPVARLLQSAGPPR